MSYDQIPNLPQIISLTSDTMMEAVQNGSSGKINLGQITAATSADAAAAAASAEDAQGAAGTATTKAAEAVASAASADAARVLAEATLARQFASLGAFQSDTTLGYTPPASVIVTAGQTVLIGSDRYTIAASAALDRHAENANGVGAYNEDFARLARPYTHHIMSRLEADSGDTNIVVLGHSAANETYEWVYQLGLWIASKYPAFTVKYRLWATTDYAAEVVMQTGTGANTLTIYNGSITGAVPDRLMVSDWDNAVGSRNPDLIMTCYGGNGSTDPAKQLALWQPLVARLGAHFPDCPVICVGDQPWVDGTGNPWGKQRLLRSMAARLGWGWISIYDAFMQAPEPLVNLYGDNLHPNAAGQQLWLKALRTAFVLEGAGVAAPSMGAFDGTILTSFWNYGQLSGWTTSGDIALSRDTTLFETGGHSTKITNSGLATGLISKTIVPAADIAPLRGQWVTFQARLYIPTGQNGFNARLAINDGVSSVNCDGRGQDGGWKWQTVTMKLSSAATQLTIYINGATVGGVAYDINIDRGVVSIGRGVVDTFAPTQDQTILGLRISSNSATPTTVFHNRNSGTSAFALLSTTVGFETDNPATQYTARIGGDRWAWKGRGDSFDRIWITPTNGQLQFGIGTADPAILLLAQSATRLALSGGSLEPNTSLAYGLGLPGRVWKDVWVKDIRPGSSAATWSSGAGSPEGVVTGDVGSLWTRTDGGAGTTLYVKETGAGNTGWVAK